MNRHIFIPDFKAIFQLKGKIFGFLLSCCFLILVSCIRSDHLFYLHSEPAACHEDDASIQMLQEAPERPHTKLAMVQAQAYGFHHASWEDLRAELCREASRIGADAIIKVSPGKIRYDYSAGPLGTAGDSKQLTGIAIRYDN